MVVVEFPCVGKVVVGASVVGVGLGAGVGEGVGCGVGENNKIFESPVTVFPPEMKRKKKIFGIFQII